MDNLYGLNFINMIKSSIQNARDVAGQHEILTRCPFCGDSANPRNAHFYISVPNTPDEVSFYDCKKCPAHGILNDEVLRKLGCQDNNTIIQVQTHNSRVLKLPKYKTLKKIAESEKSEVVVICGKFESDLAEITDEQDRKDFMDSVGLKESGLAVLARKAYHLMGLQTFFTGGQDECRAWTIHNGDTAPKAAGVIHTDFEKGFIRAEAYSIEDLRQYGSEQKIKEAGKYRQEGKDYIVKDGDVLFFKFNV